jgi:hypothetical protein
MTATSSVEGLSQLLECLPLLVQRGVGVDGHRDFDVGVSDDVPHPAEWDDAAASTGAALIPVGSHLGRLRVLGAVYRGAVSDAPLTRSMSAPWQLPELLGDIYERTSGLAKAGQAVRWGGPGLSAVGVGIAGYSEAQHHGAGLGPRSALPTQVSAPGLPGSEVIS